MSRRPGASSSEWDSDGWRQVKDYCNRFARDELRQYLIPGPSGSDPEPRPRSPIGILKTDSGQSGPHTKMSSRNVKEASPDYDRRSEERQTSLTSSNVGDSPESTITSRRLEWDSLADIGYGQDKCNAEKPLSTIERIALERHYKSELNVTINSPNAQSTPKEFQSHSSHKTDDRFIIKRKKSNAKLKSSKEANESGKSNEGNNSNPETDLPMHTRETQTAKESCVTFAPSTSTKHRINSVKVKCKIRIPKASVKRAKVKKPKYSRINYKPIANQVLPPEKGENIDQSRTPEENISVDLNATPKADSIPSEEQKSNELHSSFDNYDDELGKVGSSELIGELKFDNSNDSIPISELLSSRNKSEIASSSITISKPSSEADIIKSDNSNDAFTPENILNDSPTSLDSKLNMNVITELVNLKQPDLEANATLLKRFLKLLADSEHSEEKSKTTTPSTSRKAKMLKSTDDVTEVIQAPSLPELESETSKKTTTIDIGVNTVEKLVVNRSSITSPKTPSTQKSDPKISPKSESPKKLDEDDFSILSTDAEETKKKLDQINKEIANLLVLKTKLENKHSSHGSPKTKHDKCTSVSISLTRSQKSSPSLMTDFDTKSLGTVNKIEIPPLNLKSSPDSSNPESGVVSSTHARSSDLESSKNTSTFTKSYDTAELLCKCESKRENEVCKYCNRFTLNAGSIPDGNSSASSTIYSKLKRLEKICVRYKKCKAMKSFLKDYQNLVMEHKKKKAAMVVSKDPGSSKIVPSESTSSSIQTNDGKSTIRHKYSESPKRMREKQSASKGSSRDRISYSASDSAEATNEKLKNSEFEKSHQLTGHSDNNQFVSTLCQSFEFQKPFDDSNSTKYRSTEPISTNSKKSPSVVIPSSSYSSVIPNISKSASSSYKESSSKKSNMKRLPPDCNESSKSNYEESVASKKSGHSSVKAASTKSHMESSLLREVHSMMKKFDEHLKNLELISKMKASSSQNSSKEKLDSSVKRQPKQEVRENRISPPQSVVTELSVENSKLSRKERCDCNNKKTRKESLKKKETVERNVSKARSKPIAYNLILQPSNSILNETSIEPERKPLDQVIVKIPLKGIFNPAIGYKMPKKLPDVSTPDRKPDEYGYSTDDQLKEFSSLADDHLIRQENEDPAKVQQAFTLREYLLQNNSRFVKNLKGRQTVLKELNHLRNVQQKARREALEAKMSNVSDAKNISLSKLDSIIHTDGKTYGIPVENTFFNPREIVKRTATQYKKLPEVVDKKNNLKKAVHKRTNRVMADIFVKKLRQKTLKGIVNIAYNSNIISL